MLSMSWHNYSCLVQFYNKKGRSTMKKLLSLLLTSALAVAMLAGCGGGGDTTTTETADTGDGKV